MGKKIVIKGADFSENGFISSVVDYDEFTAEPNFLQNQSDGTIMWKDAGDPNANNYHIMVPIPQDSEKVVIDMSSAISSFKSQQPAVGGDYAILYFLSGEPSSTTAGTVETKAVSSRIEIPIGIPYTELVIPSTATILYMQVGYYNNGSLRNLRLPKVTLFAGA